MNAGPTQGADEWPDEWPSVPTSGPWVLLQCPRRHPLVSISCRGDSISFDADADDPDDVGTVHAAWPIASSAVADRPASAGPVTVDDLLAHDDDDRLRFTCPSCSAGPVITRVRLVRLYAEALELGADEIQLP